MTRTTRDTARSREAGPRAAERARVSSRVSISRDRCDQLDEYLAEQEPKGYRIEPEHRWVLEEEILLQDRDRRFLAASNTKDTVPSRASLLVQRSAPAPQAKTEKEPSKEELQEREFRSFARAVSVYEQRRLGLTDDERAEYEQYLIEAQRRLAKGELAAPAPQFYQEKYARAEEEQAEADRRTPSIKASELSDLEWEIQHIVGKLSQRDRLSEAEFQSLVTRLRIKQRQLYQSTGDWNFFTRMMDSLLNPAWDGTGTLNDIALMVMPFCAIPPGLARPARNQPLAFPPGRGRDASRGPGKSPKPHGPRSRPAADKKKPPPKGRQKGKQHSPAADKQRLRTWSMQSRLREFNRRLGKQPPSSTADEAVQRINQTLERVEDLYSGIPKKVPPPPKNMPDGRMYPKQSDFIKRQPNVSIIAETRRHKILLGRHGSITIGRSQTAQVEFHQSGVGTSHEQ